MPDSIEMEELGDRHTRSTCTVENDFDIFLLLTCDLECIDESCKYYDSCPVLVIMHDGDIEFSFEPVLYLKTSWSRYILKIDTAECISDMLHSRDEFFDILRVDNNRECINSCKLLEENTLPLHDWHRCLVTEVTKSEDS